MSEAVVLESVCAVCGAEAREGTRFCYNCGKPLPGSGESADEPVALSGSAPAVEMPETPLDGASSEAAVATVKDHAPRRDAAAERRRSRAVKRSTQEPAHSGSSSEWIFFIISLVMFIFAAFVVVIAVFRR